MQRIRTSQKLLSQLSGEGGDVEDNLSYFSGKKSLMIEGQCERQWPNPEIRLY